MPTIDIHVHIGGCQPRQTGCFMSRAQKEKLRNELPAPLALKLRLADWIGILDGQIKKRVLGFLAQAKEIDYAVILAMDGIYNEGGILDKEKTTFYVPNDYVLSLANQSSKIIPSASINPKRRDALEELERCVAAGAKIIKWLPSSQGFDPADPKFLPFYRKLAELKIPLLSHTGYEHMILSVHSSGNQAFGQPQRLKNVLDAGVTVIMAHSGTSGGPGEPDYWKDFLEMAKTWPNLWGDTAAFTHWTRAGMLEKIIHHDWCFERLIHGSDATLQPSLDQLGHLVSRDLLDSLKDNPNAIEKDFKIKKALGLPKEVFERAGMLLGLN